METAAIPGGLDARDVGQLDEAMGVDARAEAPPFGLAGLEIRELSTADGVDEKIVGLLIQRLARAREGATEALQLADVHRGWKASRRRRDQSWRLRRNMCAARSPATY